MTRFLLATLAALAVPLAHAEDAKNLLFYGNSFSGSGGGVHLLVQDLAVAAGHPEPYVYGRLVGGQTLRWHSVTGLSVITDQIPAGEHWDAVVLQGHSTRTTTHPTDGNIPEFRQAVLTLTEAVRDHSPNAQAVLFETWARAVGHDFYPTYWPDPYAMQAEVRSSYNLARDDVNTMIGPGIARVAPVGDAFEAAGFTPDLYNGDLYHANNKGALLIGFVLYGTIYNDRTVTDFDYSPIADALGVSAADAAEVAGYAEQVLAPAPASGAVLALAGVLAVRRRR
ncbi:MAG: hypothetical protein R3B49_05495 [Phycisphaerales bacterium]